MIVTITGENQYQAKQQLLELVEQFKDENSELGVNTFDGIETTKEQLSEAVMSVSLLSPVSLTVVYLASANKDLSTYIIENLETVPEDNTLVLYETDIDKRGTFYKTIKKQTDFHDHKKLDGFDLINWVVDYAQSQNGEIDRAAASFLADRVGQDQYRLSSEIDKLVNYSNKITKSDIEELVEPEPKETIFQLLDFATSGQSKKAVKTYRGLRSQRIEPHYVIAMIGWQLSNLLLVSASEQTNPNAIAKEVGLSPFVVKKAQSVLRRMSKADLRRILILTVDADMQIKSSAVDADGVVEQLILRVSD